MAGGISKHLQEIYQSMLEKLVHKMALSTISSDKMNINDTLYGYMRPFVIFTY